MIKAKGYKNGKVLKIVCDNNFKINNEYQALFNHLLSQRFMFAGTYQPEEKSMINALNVLQSYFFDKLISIEADFDEELPYEEGVIY